VFAELNDPDDVVIVTEGSTVPLGIVEVEAIVGATALAVVDPTNEIVAIIKTVAAKLEIILFNMEGPLNATSLLDATSAKFKLRSENRFLYSRIMTGK
jgi:hypothetical protein